MGEDNKLSKEEIDILKKFCNSKFYVGSKNKLLEFCNKVDSCSLKCCNKENVMNEIEKCKQKIRLELKSYLELNNVSFLFGTGATIALGAVSIRDIPQEIEDNIKKGHENLYEAFKFLISEYQDEKFVKNKKNGLWETGKKEKEDFYRWFKYKDNSKKTEKEWGKIAVPLENFLDYLLGIQYVLNYSMVNIKGKELKKDSIEELINIIKRELFKLCDIENIESNKGGKYCIKLKYHKKFIKALLGRPLNLRRANIFTTNYDLSFEDTFDELGVSYVNGFCGFNKRYFKPEVFNYDMYYPGNMTEGKVRRVEKVIKYFKLHGSLNWIREKPKANNIYGLREVPIEYIRQIYNDENSNKDLKNSKIGDMIIYPTSYKKGYTLDFPYSELFRQFASVITQPQSVLFCIGYSFFDEHINDIIYEALSIPSFTLIIVDLNGTKNENIKKLMELNDPRIIILEGGYLGDFKVFADEIMPNFHELNIEEKVAETLNKLYSDKKECEKNG